MPTTSQDRQSEAHDALAGRIRRWRDERGWSQAELAARAGFARSTLSKIENGILSPTFEILLKLARGFGVELSDLVRAEAPNASNRLQVVRGAPGPAVDYANTRLFALGGLKARRFQSAVVEFTTADLAAFGPWNSHATEDMLYVLSGRLAFHSAGYETLLLEPGDSIHFDGAMPHACLTAGQELCRCLYLWADL